jgi:predicted tellurium resistance membrane protein TerC
MFAIMGLRSLYTVLSKAASDLKYLEPAVAIVLGFIGVKMIVEFFGIPIPTELSLGVVMTLLSGGILLSIREKEKNALEADTDYQNAPDIQNEEVKVDDNLVLEVSCRDTEEKS